jgi:hypothetical protein
MDEETRKILLVHKMILEQVINRLVLLEASQKHISQKNGACLDHGACLPSEPVGETIPPAS